MYRKNKVSEILIIDLKLGSPCPKGIMFGHKTLKIVSKLQLIWTYDNFFSLRGDHKKSNFPSHHTRIEPFMSRL